MTIHTFEATFSEPERYVCGRCYSNMLDEFGECLLCGWISPYGREFVIIDDDYYRSNQDFIEEDRWV